MKEGFGALAVVVLLGCSTPPTKETQENPPATKESPPTQETETVQDPPKVGVERSSFPPEESLKGNSTVEESKPRSGDDWLRFQRERMARNPSDDLEKTRLALLLLTAGDLPEAERFLAMVKQKSDLFPYLEAYLYRKLGETQRATQLHDALLEEWRQADGFKIEKAELVASARGYLRYDPHPDGKLAPGATAILYVQPRNFTAKRDGDRYALHLTYDWKLFDDRNQEVSIPKWDNCDPNDRFDFLKFQGAVSEYYQIFRLPLPTNLASGNYRIRVTVTDKWTGRDDRIFVPFYIVPK